jgi:deoxyribodipyrimidine photolyase-related protein
LSKLILILGDQLSHSISSLKAIDKNNDVVLMCEVLDETQYVKHHKKKIAFIFSAMRHFATELEAKNITVRYSQFDDKNNSGSFTNEVARLLSSHYFSRIVVTEPGEYRVLCMINAWQTTFNVPVEVRLDDRFMCSVNEFKTWAENKSQLRMEYFYRDMRKKHHVLTEDGQPIGGKWNFDANNRQPPNLNSVIPPPYHAPIDSITQAVLDLVEHHFSEHFGDLLPFTFGVNREQALVALSTFIDERLPLFGTYQDAMIQGEPWMYHSHISLYLNCGLLLPLECIKAAQNAYYQGHAPLNAVEGFIRQILGWREYVRGVYWLNMPKYQESNYFDADRDLPSLYWGEDTKLNCLKQCVSETKKNAYAHHIQRLMVLGNFALLNGVEPSQLNTWFLLVYADAYEWVELPNVTGMALYADGGYLASKPYISGGSYINKMSNYCQHCSYNVNEKNGPSACPFNYLYWHFLDQHRDKLQSNQRLSMMYSTYDRMDETKKEQITQDAEAFLMILT